MYILLWGFQSAVGLSDFCPMASYIYCKYWQHDFELPPSNYTYFFIVGHTGHEEDRERRNIILSKQNQPHASI